MLTDHASNDDTDVLEKILAGIPKESASEEADISKKDDKQETWKDKKNTETETYEYSDDKDLSDAEW